MFELYLFQSFISSVTFVTGLIFHYFQSIDFSKQVV